MLTRVEPSVCNPLPCGHVGRKDQELREDLNGARFCDAFHRREPLENFMEGRLHLNQPYRFLDEAVDSPVQVSDVDLNVIDDEARGLRTRFGCVKPVALSSSLHRQCCDPA